MTVTPPDPVTLAGLRLVVSPAEENAVRVTFPENPLRLIMATLAVPVAPASRVPV